MSIHKVMDWIEENLALIAPALGLAVIVAAVLLHWAFG